VDLGALVPAIRFDDTIRNVVRLRFRIGVEGVWSTRTLVYPGRRTVPPQDTARGTR